MMKSRRIHGKLKKTSGCLMIKMTYYKLPSVTLDVQ